MYWRINQDPFTDLRLLQREMNRLFNGFESGAETFPAVNVWSSEKETAVAAELPGLNKNDLNITLDDGCLVIEGERKTAPQSEGFKVHRSERRSGHFRRSIRLPYEVEKDEIKAVYVNGVLTVRLPRAKAVEPRKIEIQI